MADLNLNELQGELVRSITLARKTYGECMAAYRAANGDERHRVAQVLHAAGDTINAVQGCLYTVSYALRNAGVLGTEAPSDLKLALHQLHQLAAHFHGTNADDGQCDLAMNFLSQFDEEGTRTSGVAAGDHQVKPPSDADGRAPTR